VFCFALLRLAKLSFKNGNVPMWFVSIHQKADLEEFVTSCSLELKGALKCFCLLT